MRSGSKKRVFPACSDLPLYTHSGQRILTISLVSISLSALMLAPAVVAAAATDTDSFASLDWTSRIEQSTLTDRTVMSEYIGETQALNESNGRLRVGFVPRFGCTPLIGMQFVLPEAGAKESDADEYASSSTLENDSVNDETSPPFVRSLADFDSLEFGIDGAPIDFPVLVDDDSAHASVYFNGNLQRRSTLRLLIDVGTRAEITTAAGERLSFSLLGSKDTIAAMESACKDHEPLPEPE